LGARVHVDLHQPDQCWEFVLFALTAQASHLVTHDTHVLGLGIQRPGFRDGQDTVIPHTTHKGGVGFQDLLEQRKLGVAAIEDIEALSF